MPISKKLLSALSLKHIPHSIIEHKKVFTAFDLAATAAVPLASVAKTLLVRAGKALKLVVVSAGHTVDIAKLAKALKVSAVNIVKEKDMMKNLKISNNSRLASFGSFYKLPLILDRAFAKQKKALFSGGSLTQSIHMSLKDFIRHEEPTITLIAALKKGLKKASLSKVKKKR